MRKSWQYLLLLLFLAPLSLFAQDNKDKEREMESLLQKNLTSIKVLEERLRQLDYQNRLQMESIRQQMNLAFAKDTTFYKSSLKLLQENMLRIDANYQAQLKELKEQKTNKQSALDSIFVMQEARIKAKQMEQSTMFIYGGVILILVNFILFLMLLHYFRSRQYAMAEEIKTKVQAETRATLTTYMQEDFRREIQKAFAQYAPQKATTEEIPPQVALEEKAQEVLAQIDNKSVALLEKMAQLEQYLTQVANLNTETKAPETQKNPLHEEKSQTEKNTAAPDSQAQEVLQAQPLTTAVEQPNTKEYTKQEKVEVAQPLQEAEQASEIATKEQAQEEELPKEVDEEIAKLFSFVKKEEEEKIKQDKAQEESEEEKMPEEVDLPFDFGNFFLNQKSEEGIETQEDLKETTHRSLDSSQVVAKTEKTLSTILNQEDAIEDNEDDLDQEEAIYWTQRGTIAYEKQDYEAAVECFSKALLLKEDFISYTKRANSYHNLKKYEKAAVDYEKAIKLNPDFVPAYNNAIEIHILTDNFFQALAVLEQLSKVNKPAHYKAVELYLKLIAQKALNQTSDKTERELDQVMRENFQFNYSFKEIEEWLATADIEPTNKRLIQVKMQLLKMKKAA